MSFSCALVIEERLELVEVLQDLLHPSLAFLHLTLAIVGSDLWVHLVDSFLFELEGIRGDL